MTNENENETENAVAQAVAAGTSRPSTRSTEVFFYPPLTPTPKDTQAQMSQQQQQLLSPPHPFQSYAPGSYDHRISSPAIPAPSGSSTQLQTAVDKAKLTVQQTYFVHNHHHHHHHHHHALPSLSPPQNTPRQRPSFAQVIRGSRSLRKYRYVIWGLIFLPLPPLLSVLYVLVGHALLRRAFDSPQDVNPWAPSLLSSANAAATGGIILSLPIFLLLWIIFPGSRPHPRARTPRDDFFEDDDEEEGGAGEGWMWLVWVVGVGMLVGVGSAAAALGVVCLGGETEKEDVRGIQRGRTRGRGMLDSARAAEAGIVGAAVFLGALVVLGVGVVFGWWCWRTWKEGRRQGEKV